MTNLQSTLEKWLTTTHQAAYHFVHFFYFCAHRTSDFTMLYVYILYYGNNINFKYFPKITCPTPDNSTSNVHPHKCNSKYHNPSP